LQQIVQSARKKSGIHGGNEKDAIELWDKRADKARGTSAENAERGNSDNHLKLEKAGFTANSKKRKKQTRAGT